MCIRDRCSSGRGGGGIEAEVPWDAEERVRTGRERGCLWPPTSPPPPSPSPPRTAVCFNLGVWMEPCRLRREQPRHAHVCGLHVARATPENNRCGTMNIVTYYVPYPSPCRPPSVPPSPYPSSPSPPPPSHSLPPSVPSCPPLPQQPRMRIENSSSGGPPGARPPTITRESAPCRPWRTKTRSPLVASFVCSVCTVLEVTSHTW